MEPLTLHVATGGDDAGSGTGEAPYATVERAREEVAERLRAGPPRPITVLIHAGTYHLNGTLELDGAVSGAADSPVVFAAAPGEEVVLSGGRPVTGWQREEGSGDLWSASAPTDGVFRTLRVGDRLADRARYPSADAADRIQGGWLFADWWRHPWERGRFEQPVSRVRRAGDYLQWRVTVPSAGTYRVWISYVKDESTTHPEISSVFGARGGRTGEAGRPSRHPRLALRPARGLPVRGVGRDPTAGRRARPVLGEPRRRTDRLRLRRAVQRPRLGPRREHPPDDLAPAGLRGASACARHRLPGDPGGGVLERQPRRGHRRRRAERGAPRRAGRTPRAW